MARNTNFEQLDAMVEALAVLRDLPRAEFKARLRADLERRAAMAATPGTAVNYMREGFHTITPYLVIHGAEKFIDFVVKGFGATERFRVKRPGSDMIMHAEVQIGNSIVELAEANPQFPPTPCTLLLRVSDPDAVHASAIEAGATSLEPVTDRSYGARGGSVKDTSGNSWDIFMPFPEDKIFTEFRSVTPYLNPVRSVTFIEFLGKAFGGEEVYRAQSPDGVIHHAQVRIGDSLIGMGDAHGPYQPMPSTLQLYVPDADAVYERALQAGATSLQAPVDQPYGDRSGGVTDPFGNRWWIATHFRDVAPPA